MRVSHKKLLLLFFLSGIFVLPAGALALNWPPSPAGTHLTSVSTLPALVQYLYEWGIALGGLAAFIALVIAGLQYLASMGDPTMMKDAIGRIRSAALGIVLLLASWLILNTINPDLTSFQSDAPNYDIPSAAEQKTEDALKDLVSKPCEAVSLNTSLGQKTISAGASLDITLSADDVSSSIGQIGGDDNKECSGSLFFWAKKGCNEDMLGVFGATNKSIIIDRKEAIKCIEFR